MSHQRTYAPLNPACHIISQAHDEIYRLKQEQVMCLDDDDDALNVGQRLASSTSKNNRRRSIDAYDDEDFEDKRFANEPSVLRPPTTIQAMTSSHSSLPPTMYSAQLPSSTLMQGNIFQTTRSKSHREIVQWSGTNYRVVNSWQTPQPPAAPPGKKNASRSADSNVLKARASLLDTAADSSQDAVTATLSSTEHRADEEDDASQDGPQDLLSSSSYGHGLNRTKSSIARFGAASQRHLHVSFDPIPADVVENAADHRMPTPPVSRKQSSALSEGDDSQEQDTISVPSPLAAARQARHRSLDLVRPSDAAPPAPKEVAATPQNWFGKVLSTSKSTGFLPDIGKKLLGSILSGPATPNKTAASSAQANSQAAKDSLPKLRRGSMEVTPAGLQALAAQRRNSLQVAPGIESNAAYARMFKSQEVDTRRVAGQGDDEAEEYSMLVKRTQSCTANVQQSGRSFSIARTQSIRAGASFHEGGSNAPTLQQRLAMFTRPNVQPQSKLLFQGGDDGSSDDES